MDFENQSDNRDIISIIAIQLRNSDKIYFVIFYNIISAWIMFLVIQ